MKGMMPRIRRIPGDAANPVVRNNSPQVARVLRVASILVPMKYVSAAQMNQLRIEVRVPLSRPASPR